MPCTDTESAEAVARRNAMIEELLPLVRRVYLSLRRKGLIKELSPEEVLSYGSEGLMRALDLWREGAGSNLTSFVCRGIRNGLSHAHRQQERTIPFSALESTEEGAELLNAALASEGAEPSSQLSVNQLLSLLPGREREVVERIVLGKESQKSVASDWQTSRARVSQILQKALARLRNRLGE